MGPRTSFVLWEAMIGTLLDAVARRDLPGCHVLFAGGIHDARSAAMTAAMAAPLAQRGVKVGVLLGTAYLFTAEAVATGAITPGFQQEAVRCMATVLLESGPGHATRCADTAFAQVFRAEQRGLAAEALPAGEVRARLERLNLGRLRIASKGVRRNPGGASGNGQGPGAPELVALGPGEQAAPGHVHARPSRRPAEPHRDVGRAAPRRLRERHSAARPAGAAGPAATCAPPCDIAVMGMSCLLPKAPSLQAYWQNILDKVDAIVEVPADRWDWRAYFDPTRRRRTRSPRGGEGSATLPPTGLRAAACWRWPSRSSAP